MNNELLKNAEGYTDPTAAATLNRKEAGDIWEYNDTLCLIIKSHGTFSTILQLTDLDRPENIALSIHCCGTKFVCPARITYGLHAKMGKYVGTLDVEDFNRVIDGVADALDLGIALPWKMERTTEKTDTQEAEKLQEQLTIALEHIRVLESLQNLDKAELTAANNAATKAENQLELLRDMYNELLAKVVEG